MRRAIEILRRRKDFFLIPFLVVFLVPAIATLLFMRSYEADSLVWLDTDVALSPILNETAPAKDDRPMQQAADTLQQLLKTRTFVSKIITDTPLSGRMRTPRERERTIAYVKRNLRTDVVGANSLRISFAGASRNEAVGVVGATTDAFLSWLRSEMRKQNEKSVRFFERQSQGYESELATATSRIRDFREAHPEVRELEIRDKVLDPPSVTLSAALQAEFEQLKADEEYARKLYDQSLDDLAKNRVQASAREERYANGMRILDKPVAPTSFSKRRLMLADFLALLAAVVVGSVAVGLAELTDRTFHERYDVEEALELPVLVEAGRERQDVKNA